MEADRAKRNVIPHASDENPVACRRAWLGMTKAIKTLDSRQKHAGMTEFHQWSIQRNRD
jgi:hypothetical protein